MSDINKNNEYTNDDDSIDDENPDDEPPPLMARDDEPLSDDDDEPPPLMARTKLSSATATSVAEQDAALEQATFLSQVASAVASIAMFTSSYGMIASKRNNHTGGGGRVLGSTTKKRKRLDMDVYIHDMDAKLFRRKYRMEKKSFYDLLDIIKPHLRSDGSDRKRGATPNGAISSESRLSMALRYCAGGDPLDIADIHGVGDDEVTQSVWDIVDAIHKSPELDIVFPETYAEQKDVADGFKRKSDIGISCCIGAIDGILIWIHKPSKVDEKVIKFGPAKFFCGRKKKFGLNMQAICDARGMFLDVEVRFPGTASDFFAFDESDIKKKLEKEGFLRPGYCLFGDNAYVQTPYMCTPFRNVSSGPKDAFNFFQSQVRINIECAFGMLVHRWGILRKPIPMNITVQKTTHLVLALCKLHNYCLSGNDICIEQPCTSDVSNIVSEGGLYLPRMDSKCDAQWEYDLDVQSKDRLADLLDGGQHTDDHTEDSVGSLN